MAGQSFESGGAVHRFILLSDIAGSSRLAEAFPRAYRRALAEHNGLIEAAVARHGGNLYKHTGDGCIALFELAVGCAACAAELGPALGEIAPVAEGEPLTVRIALHGGELHPAGTEYFGPALNRASRICQVCNPGQVLLSGVVAAYFGGAGGSARDALAGAAARPAGFQLRDLGEHHLRDLAGPEHLYQLDHPAFARHEFPPLATLNNRPNNLVTQPNRFIGRERELRKLAGLLLEDTRLLSIVAPGGYGKSRLAAQLSANLLHRFERGVYMAYLAPLREASDVPMTIASTLGCQFSGGRTPEQQLCDFLRAKELLLCLDNFEHVLDSAPLVAELLQAAPKLKVVITSREPLRIEGEHIYRLEPLPVEAPEDGEYSEAVRLFADRAGLVCSSFALTPQAAAGIQRICAQLSGIPLAIELAAAWTDSFTLGELQEEMAHQLDLEARTSDKPARHHSLKASLDWSWNLLGAEQQELLMRLSVFRGGFYREAAAAVLGLPGMRLRGVLAKLSDKSWLYTREVEGHTRYLLRDMLAHEYAFAKLEETRSSGGAGGSARGPLAAGTAARPTDEDSLFEQAVRSHAAYFAALVEREGPRLDGSGTPDGGAAQLAAIGIWRLELENINEALDSALHRRTGPWLLTLAKYLYRYLETASAVFMQQERYALLLQSARNSADSLLLAYAQLGMGSALYRLGDYGAALELLDQARRGFHQLGDRQAEASALRNSGIILNLQGVKTRAAELQQQALAISREIGDRRTEAGALINLAVVLIDQGEMSKGQDLLETALSIIRGSGDRHWEANCLNVLAKVAIIQSDLGRADQLYCLSLEIYREVGNLTGEAGTLGNLANIRDARGDHRGAAELQGQSLALFREIGDRWGEAFCLDSLANVYLGQGDYARAVELQSQALPICREIGDRQGEAASLQSIGNACAAQRDYARSLEMHNQALALFRGAEDRQGESATLVSMASVYRVTGDFARSLDLYEQALTLCREIGETRVEGVVQDGLAAVRQAQGDHRGATVLFRQALVIFGTADFQPGRILVCVHSAASLAALGAWHAAAVAFWGGQARAAEMNQHWDLDERSLLNGVQARLDTALAAGNVTADQLAQLRATAEALSLDELVEFVLAELGKPKDVVGEASRPAEA